MTATGPAIEIAPETPADVAAVASVVARAFSREPEVAELVRLIRASPQYRPDLALVARVGGEVVGFVMISRAIVVDGPTRHPVHTLSPLAVAPPFQRRGIGSALVAAVLAAADAAGAGLVTLEGSPAFYGRLGFRPAAAFGVEIELPDWAPAAAAQAYPLRAHDPAVRGRLEYPPAFTTYRTG